MQETFTTQDAAEEEESTVPDFDFAGNLVRPTCALGHRMGGWLTPAHPLHLPRTLQARFDKEAVFEEFAVSSA